MILVTGATGKVGRHLVTGLLAEGAPVRASAHLPAAAVDDLLRYWADYAGRSAEMSPDLEKVAGRPAMTFAEWATRHAASVR